MRHPLIITGLISTISSTVSADIFGFEVGAYAWQQNYDGFVQSGNDVLDLDNQLSYDDEINSTYYALLEHPIPLIPNVLIQHTELGHSENSISTNFTFAGVTLPGGIPFRSTSDLSHTDGTLYYEILDNWVSLDIGLTIRRFEEGIQIKSDAGNTALNLDQTLPMGYLAAEFDLPFSGLYISADLNTITYRGEGLHDYKVNIGYENTLGFGAELGYRSFEINYKDDDEVVDVIVEGIYAGIYYHF